MPIKNLLIYFLVIKGASDNPGLDLLHRLDLFVHSVVDNSGDESFRFLAINLGIIIKRCKEKRQWHRDDKIED